MTHSELQMAGKICTKADAVAAEIANIAGAPKPAIVLADLTEMKDVIRASAEIGARFGHVDVLINNAGAMYDLYHASSEGIEDAYAVNHLAVFLLTLSLYPSLKNAAQPSVVIVSSNIHENAPYIGNYGSLLAPKYEWSKIYAQTKLRNMIFTRALSALWAGDGISVNALHPGVVDTGLMSGWHNPLVKAIFGVVQKFFLPPEKGARTSVFLATDPSVTDITGQYFSSCAPHRYNRIADDVTVQRQLWEESIGFLKQAGIDPTLLHST